MGGRAKEALGGRVGEGNMKMGLFASLRSPEEPLAHLGLLSFISSAH